MHGYHQHEKLMNNAAAGVWVTANDVDTGRYIQTGWYYRCDHVRPPGVLLRDASLGPAREVRIMQMQPDQQGLTD